MPSILHTGHVEFLRAVPYCHNINGNCHVLLPTNPKQQALRENERRSQYISQLPIGCDVGWGIHHFSEIHSGINWWHSFLQPFCTYWEDPNILASVMCRNECHYCLIKAPKHYGIRTQLKRTFQISILILRYIYLFGKNPKTNTLFGSLAPS